MKKKKKKNRNKSISVLENKKVSPLYLQKLWGVTEGKNNDIEFKNVTKTQNMPR